MDPELKRLTAEERREHLERGLRDYKRAKWLPRFLEELSAVCGYQIDDAAVVPPREAERFHRAYWDACKAAEPDEFPVDALQEVCDRLAGIQSIAREIDMVLLSQRDLAIRVNGGAVLNNARAVFDLLTPIGGGGLYLGSADAVDGICLDTYFDGKHDSDGDVPTCDLTVWGRFLRFRPSR